MQRKLKTLKLLLWYKELQEEQAKIRQHHARLHLERLMEEKRLLEEEYKECYDYLTMKKALTGEELRSWANYFETIREFQDIADNKIKKQEEVLQELSEDLMAKYREKRLVDNLYRRYSSLYRWEMAKRELKTLDDLILLRKGRKLA